MTFFCTDPPPLHPLWPLLSHMGLLWTGTRKTAYVRCVGARSPPVCLFKQMPFLSHQVEIVVTKYHPHFSPSKYHVSFLFSGNLLQIRFLVQRNKMLKFNRACVHIQRSSWCRTICPGALSYASRNFFFRTALHTVWFKIMNLILSRKDTFCLYLNPVL